MSFRAVFLCILIILTNQARAGAPAESKWTWLGPQDGDLGPFVFSAEDPALIFAGSLNGVYRSRDAGASWTRLAAGLTDPLVTALARGASGLLAGTLRHGVFRSPDEGETWVPVDAATAETEVFAWPSLAATVEYQSQNGSTATTLPLVPHPLSAIRFLQVAQSTGSTIFQGLAMLDVGTPDPFERFSIGSLWTYDSNGAQTGFSIFSQNAGRVSGLLNEPLLLGPGFHQEGGHIELFSLHQIVAYTIFGSGRFLAAVEAQGVALYLY